MTRGRTAKRGFIELTAATYASLSRYMKQFKGKTYYTSYPVKNRFAQEDTLVEPDGTRTQLCF